jgi:hypothetical protein
MNEELVKYVIYGFFIGQFIWIVWKLLDIIDLLNEILARLPY